MAVLRKIRDNYCNNGQSFFHFYLFDTDEWAVPLNWTLSKSIADHIWNDAMGMGNNPDEYENLKKCLRQMPVEACR